MHGFRRASHPSHDVVGDIVNTIRDPDDDATLENEEEEEALVENWALVTGQYSH